MLAYLISWWRWLLRKFSWIGYLSGEVVETWPEIAGQLGPGSIQWRIKRTRYGAKRFVSARLKPSFYYGSRSSPNCFVNLDLAPARLALAQLNELIEALEKETHREPARP